MSKRKQETESTGQKIPRLSTLSYNSLRAEWDYQVPEHILQHVDEFDEMMHEQEQQRLVTQHLTQQQQRITQEQQRLIGNCHNILHNYDNSSKEDLIKCLSKALTSLYVAHHRERSDILKFTQHCYLFREININPDDIPDDLRIIENFFGSEPFWAHIHSASEGIQNERMQRIKDKHIMKSYLHMYITFLETLPRRTIIEHIKSFLLDVQTDPQLQFPTFN